MIHIIGVVFVIKNQKGQAFLEFVLILPIIVLLLLGVVSIGIIFIRKNELENQVVDIIQIWKEQDSSLKELENLLKKEGLEVSIMKNATTSFVTIQVKEKVPLLGPIQKEFPIEVKRVIPLE